MPESEEEKVSEMNEEKIKEFQSWLEIRNFSTETVNLYTFYARDFLKYIGKNCAALAQNDIETYLEHYKKRRDENRILKKEHKGKRRGKDRDRCTGISYNVLAGIFKLYEFLNIQINKKAFKMRQPKRLEPRVLTEAEIQKLLNAEMPLRTKTLIALLLSSGLRISEASRLRYADIDEKTLTIRVRYGKGSKSRTTIISALALEYINKYQTACHAVGVVSRFVFPGNTADVPANKRSLQNILAAEFEKLSIDATAHSARHTFATSLLAKGVSLTAIQKMLGHSSLETSSIYLHIFAADVKEIASKKLFDSIEISAKPH